MRQSGRGDGLADYGCLEEMAMMVSREECSSKKGQGARRPPPPMGRGVARWRDRRPGRLWRCTCGGGEVTRHRSGRVCQMDDKMAFECITGAAAATSGWSLSGAEDNILINGLGRRSGSASSCPLDCRLPLGSQEETTGN